MQIITLSLGQLSTNCYIVYEEHRTHAILIDPADDADAIRAVLAQNGLQIGAILLTHGHFDHTMAVDPLLDTENAEFFVSSPDAALLTDHTLNGSSLFLGEDIIVNHAPTHLLQDGEEFSPEKTGLSVRVLMTPGHTAGSAVFGIGDSLFTGDLLFHLMVGRTDLPTGNADAMKSSLSRIRSLTEDHPIYPGHGQASLLSYEKKHNIFLR